MMIKYEKYKQILAVNIARRIASFAIRTRFRSQVATAVNNKDDRAKRYDTKITICVINENRFYKTRSSLKYETG
ncbi:ATP-dependent helicase [Dirofilaria immitis]